MKSILLALLTLAAVSLAFASESDRSLNSSTSEYDMLERMFAPIRLSRGMTPQAVRDTLGQPDATLAPNVWVYWDFKPKDAPRAGKTDTLLLIFAENRVQRLRLVDSRPVRAIIAQQQAKAASNAIAAQ